jgi:hypothetical protein
MKKKIRNGKRMESVENKSYKILDGYYFFKKLE